MSNSTKHRSRRTSASKYYRSTPSADSSGGISDQASLYASGSPMVTTSIGKAIGRALIRLMPTNYNSGKHRNGRP